MAKKLRSVKAFAKRTNRLIITLNDEEAAALDYYVKKYKRGTQTKAGIIRELLMSQVIQRCESDPELLFSDDEMR